MKPWRGTLDTLGLGTAFPRSGRCFLLPRAILLGAYVNARLKKEQRRACPWCLAVRTCAFLQMLLHSRAS